MTIENKLGGKFTFKNGNTVNRIGYGAMQLTGPMAWGEPRDRKEAIAVVREAIALGINHIDTSDYYGPYIANSIIREAIYPYPDNLTIVTKVGVTRGPDKEWPQALSKEDLTTAIHDNLRNLSLDAIEIVNLRLGNARGTNDDSIAEPLMAMADLKKQGLIRHIGLSNITYKQYQEAEQITDIVCVQNHYNAANRHDDAMIDNLAQKGIAFVPYFPMGGFREIQSEKLEKIAATLGATTKQILLAWLLQRSPNILLIPGTSSVAHLRENIKAGELQLTAEMVEEINKL
jgi:pyridoxine 4-dehydrogenase